DFLVHGYKHIDNSQLKFPGGRPTSRVRHRSRQIPEVLRESPVSCAAEALGYFFAAAGEPAVFMACSFLYPWTTRSCALASASACDFAPSAVFAFASSLLVFCSS